jgi:hypothetical protein
VVDELIGCQRITQAAAQRGWLCWGWPPGSVGFWLQQLRSLLTGQPGSDVSGGLWQICVAQLSYCICIPCAACLALHGAMHCMSPDCSICCCCASGRMPIVQAPDDEPVWRQLLRLHLDHSNPIIAKQAAAALAE